MMETLPDLIDPPDPVEDALDWLEVIISDTEDDLEALPDCAGLKHKLRSLRYALVLARRGAAVQHQQKEGHDE